jgi:hypothetical protein
MLICGADTHSNDPGRDPADDMKEIFGWFEKWGQAGKIADPGVELDSVRKAKTVRPGPDGKPVVTDGPYLELKEIVGGLVILNADSIDEAVEVAATWPMSGSGSVEVRPIIEH